MKLFFFSILSIFSLTLSAQLINKGDLKISSGTTVYISGLDVINDNGTTHIWSNDGNFIFKGNNFTNNGTMDANASGTTEFSGVNEQNILGTSTANFHNLVINNANNSVIQQSFVDTDNINVNDGGTDFDYKVATDKSLTVNDAVTLNGDMRMMGTSQLVQTHTGATSNSGSKYLWIDQQGTTNQYWYNYWSSPVNRGGTWKMMYLKDGALGDDIDQTKYQDVGIVNNTNATNDLPAQNAHPVALNAYWIWSFPNGLDGSYTGWVHIQENGAVNPGEGYTMKGPGVDAGLNAANGGATTEYNSWTFAGLPNDGDYNNLTIDPGHDYMIGNPYPSAMDADQFIKDNISAGNGGNNANDIFNGTLYFWEHTGGNDHFGANYQGGYATYNLTGGTAATDWQGNGTTVGTKTPQSFIPVGQGFSIWADTNNDGGNIVFKNSQRKFETEGANSVFIRPAALTNIRLGFDTPQNYHRQILLGIRPQTTNGVDVGWDAPNFDSDYPGADMNWLLYNKGYVIQAVPQINEASRFPLKVVADTEALVSFTLDEVENLPAGIQTLYIYDSFDNTYHPVDLQNNYEVYLNAGTYDSRFELVFKNGTLSNDELQLNHISGYYNNNSKAIEILNNEQQTIESMHLYALTGQEILSKKLMSQETKISIPARLTTGIYLLKVVSDSQKVYTTKVLVK